MIFKRIVFLTVFLTVSFGVFAQEGGDRKSWEEKKQQFKANKIAYISTGLNLSVEEAQKFWPVYNKYDEILDSLGEERRRQRGKCDNLCENDCKQMLDSNFDLDKKELQTRLDFYEELKKVFPYTKIMTYYKLEHEFRRKVVCEKQPVSGSLGKSFKNN